MRRTSAEITSQTLEPTGKPALNIKTDQPLSIAPGQFLLAWNPEDLSPVRTRFFPVKQSGSAITCDHIPGHAWLPGQRIDILAPFGSAFAPPPDAERWLLLSLGNHPERLLTLVEMGLHLGASLAFWGAQHVPPLPEQVEVSPSIGDSLDWAEYIAVELVTLDDLAALPRAATEERLSQIEVMLDAPTPCGIGACQACALPSRRGFTLACRDGLVRRLEALHG